MWIFLGGMLGGLTWPKAQGGMIIGQRIVRLSNYRAYFQETLTYIRGSNDQIFLETLR